MVSTDDHVTILIGPTCATCESDDLRWGAPLGALREDSCRNCGTEHRRYQALPRCDSDRIEAPPEPTCPSCGLPHHEHETGSPFCEDCEPSDCAYCGAPTNRCNLSSNLACRVCEEGEAA